MVTEVIHFCTKASTSEAFKSLTIKSVTDRRAAPGNLRAELFQQVDQSNHFILIETFDTQATIDQYYMSEGYRHWHQLTENMLEKMEANDFALIA